MAQTSISIAIPDTIGADATMVDVSSLAGANRTLILPIGATDSVQLRVGPDGTYSHSVALLPGAISGSADGKAITQSFSGAYFGLKRTAGTGTSQVAYLCGDPSPA